MHPSRGSSACREQASVLASPAAASMRSRSYAASPGGRSPGRRTCRLYRLPVAWGRTGRWRQLHQDWHGSPANRGGCLRGTNSRRFADGCLGQVPTHEGSSVRSIACWIANSCSPFQGVALLRSSKQFANRAKMGDNSIINFPNVTDNTYSRHLLVRTYKDHSNCKLVVHDRK
jgi:hypothetical protein